jgi:hypothetical protein
MASLYSSVRKRLVSLAMTVSIFAQNMTDLGIAGQLKTCRRSAEQSPRGFEALLANHVLHNRPARNKCGHIRAAASSQGREVIIT